MPVTKERPHIIDLLNLAAGQQRKRDESKIDILSRPLYIWFTAEDDNFALSHPWRYWLYATFLGYSHMCERFSVTTVMKVVRAASWIVLLIVLINTAPALQLSHDSRPTLVELEGYSAERRNFYNVSVVVNVWLLLNSVVEISGIFIRTKVEKAFNREMSTKSIILDMGLLSFTLDILCLSYGVSEVGLWFQVSRLVLLTQFVLDLFPTIGILMSGIGNGFKSVMYTILLLFLLACSFAIIGHDLYQENDPFHFGSFALSCLTFFQLTTFESWGEIFALNYGGCDSFAGVYSGRGSTRVPAIITDFGIFYAPVCDKPSARPVASVFIFCIYSVLGGYVIVSMCLAAVAIGINERLEELRNLELFGEEQEEEPEHSYSQKSFRSSPGLDSVDAKAEAKKRKQIYDGKAAKMLGGNIAGRKIKENLTRVWDTMRKGSKHKFFGNSHHGHGGKSSRRKLSLSNLSVDTLSKEARILIKDFNYQMVYSILIMLAAVLQFHDETVGFVSTNNSVVHLFFQVLFLADSCMRFLAYYEKPAEFFTSDYWNAFDLTITIILFVPTVQVDNSSTQFLNFLKIFRMARILQIASSFAMDLHVILAAIYHSAICLGYVLFIMFLYFSYFGLIGVLLFKRANPFYFSGYGVALRTLLQSMTLDNWSEIMRYGMLGCHDYPYPTEMASYCDDVSGKGVGWFAAAFFVFFIIVASYVLSSLLVGVIITSMELLREGILEEADIWAKVGKIQKRYNVEQSSIDLLLELFESSDEKRDGIVTYESLETMMSTMGIEEDNLFAYYVKVDEDKNGQLDFAEFCEVILLLGPLYNERKDEEERVKREAKKIKDESKRKKSFQAENATALSAEVAVETSSIRSRTFSFRSQPAATHPPLSSPSSSTKALKTAATATNSSTSSSAALVLEDVTDTSNAFAETADGQGNPQSQGVESKEDPLRVRIKSLASAASSKPPVATSSFLASSSFLSRVSRIYSIAEQVDEHEDYFHHHR